MFKLLSLADFVGCDSDSGLRSYVTLIGGPSYLGRVRVCVQIKELIRHWRLLRDGG